MRTPGFETRRKSKRTIKGGKPRRCRVLRSESLENRYLLAGDLGFSHNGFSHNFAHPEDVDADGAVNAFDAVAVISAIRNQAHGQQINHFFVDVDGNRDLHAFDAILVIGALRGHRAESQAPVENRIARLRESIESGDLPDHVSEQRAREILETLENGGMPELGESIRPSGFAGFEGTDQWELANRILDILQDRGVDTARAQDWIQDVREVLPNSETPLHDLLSGIDSEQAIDTVDRIFEVLEANDVNSGAAERWLTDIGDLIPESETPLEDLVARLRTDRAALSDEILAILNSNGVETSTARQWIEDFEGLTAGSETPLRDLRDALRNDREGLADQILQILEGNGVETAEARDWIDGFLGLLPDTQTPIRDVLQGDRQALLDDIFSVLEANGVSTTEARGWVSDIQEQFGDGDTPILRDLLDRLEAGQGESLTGSILNFLESRGVNTSSGLPWVSFGFDVLADSGLGGVLAAFRRRS